MTSDLVMRLRAASDHVDDEETAALLHEAAIAVTSLRSLFADQAAATEQTCTGLTAMWCPVHGDCSCPQKPGVEGPGDDGTCPLHAWDSPHSDGGQP